MAYGQGQTGAAPTPQQGSAIDSVSSRLESVCAALGHIIERAARVADSTMGTRPTEVTPSKMDHPPQTLQEWTSFLEDKITALDVQISRFF